MKKTFPRFGNFLATKLNFDPTTVGNTIRFCREAGFITKGSSGRGASEVTPLDAAAVLIAVVSGWGLKPREGVYTLSRLRLLRPVDTSQWSLQKENLSEDQLKRTKEGHAALETLQTQPMFDGFSKDWWRAHYDEVLARVIEARIADVTFSEPELRFQISNRGTGWAMGYVCYGFPADKEYKETGYRLPDSERGETLSTKPVEGIRGINDRMSLEYWIPLVIADWLADRDTSWTDGGPNQMSPADLYRIG
jgi:hypothetical protein